MEEKSFRGVWWSPEHREVEIDVNTDLSTIPDGATAGIVKYDPGSLVQIELIGELGRPDNVSELSYIHGMTTEGDKITISDCLSKSVTRTEGSGYFATENWVGQDIFHHEHTLDGEYSSIDLHFPNLEHWTNTGTLERDDEDDQYDPRKKVVKTGRDDFSIKLVMLDYPSPHEFSSYVDSAMFSLDFNSPQNYDTISTEYIRPIQNFLSLAMINPIFPSVIRCGDVRNKIEIYPYDINYTDVDDIYPNSMFFTLDDIDFETAILEWFDHHDDIKTLHNLYFSTLYSDSMFLELEFLSLVIGLETYHRRAFPGDYHMEDMPYEAYRKAAKERLPDVAAKGRTMDLLNSIGNDYSLRERLESVVSEHRSILNSLMDVDETLKQSTNFRHELAHGLNSSQDKQELSQISSRLRAICEVFFLRAVGLEEAEITNTLTGHYRRHTHFKGEPPEHL